MTTFEACEKTIKNIFHLAKKGDLPINYFFKTIGLIRGSGNTELAEALLNTYVAGRLINSAQFEYSHELLQYFKCDLNATYYGDNGDYNNAIQYWDEASKYTENLSLIQTRQACLVLQSVWGDPIPQRLPQKDRICITMKDLGCNGRFGNQLFQYGMLRIYAAIHGLEVQTPHWIGRHLFDLDDPLPSGEYIDVNEDVVNVCPNINKDNLVTMSELFEKQNKAPSRNINFWGYCVAHASLMKPYKDLWRKCFRLGKNATKTFQPIMSQLPTAEDATLVAIHVRRGDIVSLKMKITPIEWYISWIASIWDTLSNPILYIASDDQALINHFSRYNPISCRIFSTTIHPKVEYLIDHQVLQYANIVASSNSSFSISACMLNRNDANGRYFRPDFIVQRLMPFDPWNTRTCYRAHAGDQG